MKMKNITHKETQAAWTNEVIAAYQAQMAEAAQRMGAQ